MARLDDRASIQRTRKGSAIVRAEELISLAGVHGIDPESLRQGMAKAKRDVKNNHAHGLNSSSLLEPRANRAHGTETPTAARPEWTLAECGQAAAGVPQLPYLAVCYAFAGDRSRYRRLQCALYDEAQRLAKRHNWPKEVLDFHGIECSYLERIAKLVLDEDGNPSLFLICPELFSFYLSVPAAVWEKQIAPRFYELKLIWLEWLTVAARIMQPRLRREEEEEA